MATVLLLLFGGYCFDCVCLSLFLFKALLETHRSFLRDSVAVCFVLSLIRSHHVIVRRFIIS